MKRKGFTLIELLVTIAIIGILTAISIFGLNGARQSARDAKRKADLETIRSGLELYNADCGSYPDSLVGTQLAGTTGSCSGNVYISLVPTDPIPGRLYSYVPGSSNATYTLCATLELPPSTGNPYCVQNP